MVKESPSIGIKSQNQLEYNRKTNWPETIEKFISKIVRNLEGLGESEIPTPTIGKFIMEGLSSLDKVAYNVLLLFTKILKKRKILRNL